MKKTRNGQLILLAFVGLLSGCATHSVDLETPIQQVAPQAWSSHPLTSEHAIDVAQFWEAWNDLVLLSLIQKAQQSNTDVLTAYATLKAARANLKEASTMANR